MLTKQEHIARLEEVVNTSTNPFVTKLLLTQLSEYNQPETNAQLALLQTHEDIEKHLLFIDEETGIICLLIDGVLYLKQPIVEREKEVNPEQRWDRWNSNDRMPW